MKRLILCVLCLLAGFTSLMAQTKNDNSSQHRMWNDAFMQQQRADSLTRDSLTRDSLSVPLPAESSITAELPWNVPVVNLGAYGMGGYGALYNDWGWRLHEGFNAQFGLSVSAGLGKHAPKGVGFGQTAAFAYLKPLTPCLSVAAGVFATNFDWGSWRRTDVGIGGVVAYKVNDNINLYAYGQKTFLPRQTDLWGRQVRRDPFPVFFDVPRDRIGAAAEFKIGNNAMIGVSVEHRSY